MPRPERVKLVEVGPRDGLQNESRFVPTAVKLELIRRLAAAGLQAIEVTSFVSPKWVPQLADAVEILSGLDLHGAVSYPVLVPNLKGLEGALAAGARDIALFAAASETFSQKNLNCSIATSLERFGEVAAAALAKGVKVRGYVSCVLGCPFEGVIAPETVAKVAEQLLQLGAYEISLGDTIGVGTPAAAQALIDKVAQVVPRERLAGHFHDTYGQALANILAVLERGVATFDSSVAGLGGCPYAPGATGNVASEDLLYMLDGLGIETGVSLPALVAAGEFISRALGRPSNSKVARALDCRPASTDSSFEQ